MGLQWISRSAGKDRLVLQSNCPGNFFSRLVFNIKHIIFFLLLFLSVYRFKAQAVLLTVSFLGSRLLPLFISLSLSLSLFLSFFLCIYIYIYIYISLPLSLSYIFFCHTFFSGCLYYSGKTCVPLMGWRGLVTKWSTFLCTCLSNEMIWTKHRLNGTQGCSIYGWYFLLFLINLKGGIV